MKPILTIEDIDKLKMDEIEVSLPMWENKPPAYKGSSYKSGRSEKQIKKDRKKKKMNKRNRKK